MFTKVLFCTDFSATADKAFKYAVRAASHNGAKLYILHVMPEADAQFWKGYVYEEGQDLEDKALKALQEKVAATYVPAIPEGVEYETAYRVGAAAQQILDFAKEYSDKLLAIDVNLDTTEMLDVTWKLLYKYFKLEEVNIKKELTDQYWHE